MNQPRHIRHKIVKLREPDLFGYETLCAERVPDATVSHTGELTCLACLMEYVRRQDAELVALKDILLNKGRLQ